MLRSPAKQQGFGVVFPPCDTRRQARRTPITSTARGLPHLSPLSASSAARGCRRVASARERTASRSASRAQGARARAKEPAGRRPPAPGDCGRSTVARRAGSHPPLQASPERDGETSGREIGPSAAGRGLRFGSGHSRVEPGEGVHHCDVHALVVHARPRIALAKRHIRDQRDTAGGGACPLRAAVRAFRLRPGLATSGGDIPPCSVATSGFAVRTRAALGWRGR